MNFDIISRLQKDQTPGIPNFKALPMRDIDRYMIIKFKYELQFHSSRKIHGNNVLETASLNGA